MASRRRKKEPEKKRRRKAHAAKAPTEAPKKAAKPRTKKGSSTASRRRALAGEKKPAKKSGAKKSAKKRGAKKRAQAKPDKARRKQVYGKPAEPKRTAKKTAAPKKAAKKTAAPKTTAKRKASSKKPAAVKRPAKKSGSKKSGAKKPAATVKYSGQRQKQVRSEPRAHTVPNSVLADTRKHVVELLQRQHGFDPRLAKNIVESFKDEIKGWKSIGLTSVDIAIEIQQAVAAEGLQVQETIERAHLKQKDVSTKLESLRMKLASLRDTIVRSKYEHGYVPPTTDVWMTMSETGAFTGFHQYVPIVEVLTHSNVESIVREVTKAAHRVWAQHPNGFLFSAIELYEYGKDAVGSSREVFLSDRDGEFAYAMQAHKGVHPAQYEKTIRRKLKSLLLSDKSAVVIESITVKSFGPS